MDNALFNKRFALFLVSVFWLTGIWAQTSDSVIVNAMRKQGVTFSHDNSVTFLTDGQEKFDDLFAAVKQARKSIHLEYFNFRHDSIAGRLFDLLASRARDGVKVRALFDAFGNASNNKPLSEKDLKKIRKRGIEIYTFDPLKWPWVNHVFHRDHRKIVVIDGHTGYIGGMNVADYYIKGKKEVGTWRDMHCRIEGSEVNSLQRIFLNIWNKTTGQHVDGEELFGGGIIDAFKGLKPDTCITKGRKMVGIVNREPRKTNRIIRSYFLEAINSAKDSIKIINPYFTLNSDLKRALIKAVGRGVKVEVMLSIHSDIPLTPDCALYNVHQLMKKGVHVWMYKPGFHHSKIMIIDDKYCSVGSANMDARSMRYDYEANALIIDRETTRQLSTIFDNEKGESFELTKENWNELRTGWQKFVGWFAHLLSPFL